MCRECDNSSLEWTEKDEREVEIARGDAIKSIDRSIKILEENINIIDSLQDDMNKLSEGVNKL